MHSSGLQPQSHPQGAGKPTGLPNPQTSSHARPPLSTHHTCTLDPDSSVERKEKEKQGG